jgi:hypothetical protein
MPNSLSTHISSGIGVVLAVLTALDKSITVTSDQRAVIVSILVALAGVLQLAHMGLKAKALSIYGSVESVTKSVEAKLPASVQTDVNAVADQVIGEVKTAVDTGATPTLAEVPSAPIA